MLELWEHLRPRAVGLHYGDPPVSFQLSPPGLPLSLVPPCVCVWIPIVLPLLHMTFIWHLYFAPERIRWKWSQHCAVLGFELILATAGSTFQFDAADRSGFVCCTCPCLCQIKGQHLDSEASLLFVLVQPWERPNKSGGNVVTWEPERSLPTGRGKWRDIHSDSH